jgi:hypothetical protein
MLGFAGFISILAFGGLWVAAPILGVIGGCFVLRAPSRSGASGFGIAALVLDALLLLGVILYFATVGMAATRRDPLGAGAMFFLTMLMMFLSFVGGFVVQMLMFRILAVFVKDRYATGATIGYMISFLAVSIGGPIVLFLLALVLRHAYIFGAIIIFSMMMGLVTTLSIILFRIAVLVRDIRSGI